MSSSEYTKEQQEVVEMILKIEKTDYYNILSIDKKSTDIEIKKSYRKLAIKLHPDKNNHPQSAEAFKKLAKAFEVLSDEEKRRIYDQTGSDPDSRGGMPSTSSGFARHAGTGGAGGFRGNPFMNMNGGTGMFDDDIFNMFFGGGGMPGGNGFTTFSFGGPGGPTFRTTGGRGFPGMHQRQQHHRRQGGARGANGTANDNENKTLWDQLAQLAPLLVILIPMLFNFLAGDGSSDRLPTFAFETSPVLPVERTTPVHNIPYYIGKKSFEELSTNPKKLRSLDQKVETYYVNDLRMKCRREEEYKDKLIEESYGWFFADAEKLEKAQAYETKNCNRLKDMRLL